MIYANFVGTFFPTFVNSTTFVSMNEEMLSPAQAWEDFYSWIRSEENKAKWQSITRVEKQYLDKTNRAVMTGNAGTAWVKKALEKYAPGRYKFIITQGFKLVE